jgi:hypothetical protein
MSFSPQWQVPHRHGEEHEPVDVFPVAADGTLDDPVFNQSSGPEPFGFAFRGQKHFIVSEPFNGAPGASAVSSYNCATEHYA